MGANAHTTGRPEADRSGTRLRVLVVIPPPLYGELFTPESDAALRALAEVTCRADDRKLSSADLAALLPGYDAVVTGWGTPPFTAAVLDAADRLRIVAHSAGSVKAILPPAVLERGIAITHASSALAPAVAETALLLVLLGLQPVHKYDRALRTGVRWKEAKAFGPGHELGMQRVGVIGASTVGIHFIGLVRAFGSEIWVYDPYLSAERAAALGVTRAALDDLLAQCPVVAVHAPTTPETHHMIGERELARLRDGAVLVNTARSWVVDQEALLAELRAGRIIAALDVFDTEPLPLDSPFRGLENVILTPHVAAAAVETRRRQGATVVAELGRFFAGQPLQHAITRARYDMLA